MRDWISGDGYNYGSSHYVGRNWNG